MIEKTHEELIKVSEEDIAFYNKCIEGLPKRSGINGNYKDKYGIEIPYGSEAHVVRHFKRAIEIVNPKGILEIGFNLGHGSAILLSLCNATVVSIDISDKYETLWADAVLSHKHEWRFFFYLRKDFILKNYAETFDMAWIDGDHSRDAVIEDINLCRALQIPYLLFDDIMPRYGPGVMEAIGNFPQLELVEDMDNIRLYKWASNDY